MLASENTNPTKEEYIEKYLEQLSDREKIVIEIAQSVLNSSFNIYRSIGFKEWEKENQLNN
jgi:hypothetical protein